MSCAYSWTITNNRCPCHHNVGNPKVNNKILPSFFQHSKMHCYQIYLDIDKYIHNLTMSSPSHLG